MAWWRRAQCPPRPVEQDWIERSLDWMVGELVATIAHELGHVLLLRRGLRHLAQRDRSA